MAPMPARAKAVRGASPRKRRNGRNTISARARRTAEMKALSTPASCPLVRPNENAQISETRIRKGMKRRGRSTLGRCAELKGVTLQRDDGFAVDARRLVAPLANRDQRGVAEGGFAG